MKAQEIILILKADGWYETKRAGSHVHFRHPIKAGLVIVPFHSKDISKGTEQAIYKQAGLR